jgi:hypothetical protein
MNKMYVRFALSILLAAMLIGPVIAKDDHDDSPIVKHMERVASNYKKLRRQARRMKFDDTSVKMVAQMQIHVIGAMHENFEVAEKLSGKEKKLMILNFRKDMSKLVKKLLDLEIALLEDRKADAKRMIGELAKHKSDGHEKYTEEGGES